MPGNTAPDGHCWVTSGKRRSLAEPLAPHLGNEREKDEPARVSVENQSLWKGPCWSPGGSLHLCDLWQLQGARLVAPLALCPGGCSCLGGSCPSTVQAAVTLPRARLSLGLGFYLQDEVGAKCPICWLVAKSRPTLCDPCGLQPTRLLCPWDIPFKNTAVGCHSPLQGSFPTQGSNLCLLHCRQILYCWAAREAQAPRDLFNGDKPCSGWGVHARDIPESAALACSLPREISRQQRSGVEDGLQGTCVQIPSWTKDSACPTLVSSSVLLLCWAALSHVWLFATPRTVARQAPLSVEFPGQEYSNRLPFPPPEDLPHPGIEPASPASPALAGGFFTTRATWEALSSSVNGLKTLGRLLQWAEGY